MKATPARSLGQIGRAAMNVALAAILAIGLLPSSSIGGGKAYADTGSVWISNNGSEVYDGYNTNFFTANGQVAWCSQPNLSTPAGSYSYWTARGDTSTAWTAYAVAMLYADTSSIFDNDPRVGHPLTSLDNNPVKDGVGWYLDRIRDSYNNDDSWYTRSHVLLSYAASKAMPSWCDPFKGCTNRGDWEAQCSEFWSACWTIASGGCLPGVSQAECDELRAVAQTSEMAFTSTSGSQSVTWLAKIGVGYGAIDLSKASADPSITEGNPLYTLSGARYGIYRSWNDASSRASEAASMTTDAGGYAWCGRLAQGTYYVRETAAPAGYEVDDAIYEVRVNAGATVRVNGGQVSDEVASLNGGPVLAKYDAEGAYVEGGNAPQGDATLALAEYTIKYYAANDAAGTPARTWVLRTDESGQIDLAKAKGSFDLDGQTYSRKVSGDDFYEHRGSICLPLGTVTVQETRAPQGYLLPDPAPVRVGHIKQGHTASIIWEDGKFVQDENTDAVKQADGETVVRCGLSVDKSDFETKEFAALGGAKLDGAVFEVVNKSKRDVRVGGVLYGNGEVVTTLTVADGRATTDADGDGVDRTLPYGTYTVRETIAGEGYNISEDVVDVTIDDFARDGAVVEKSRADGADIENKVKRGDVEFTKADASTGKRLAGVAFSITSETTGESHVAVTDGNGYFSSSAAKHSDKTNANDAAVTYEDGQAVVDSSKLDANAGIWFGAWGEGKTADAEDSLGALPWDTYTVRELRCEGNSGLQLVSDIKLVVSKDKVSVTLGTIDDTVPTVSTTAFVGELGNKRLTADADAVELSDRVAYAGVVPGFEYTVRGTVYDKSTGAPLLIAGKKVCAEKTFTADGVSGQVELGFALADTSAIADGAKLVVYEDLYQGREKVASHADISDSEQTVTVARPNIGTTAQDGESGTHDAVRDIEMRVADDVAYKGCIPGREYKVAGKLVDKSTGQAIRDARGAEVVAEATFTPETAEGSVEVVFAFDGSNLAEGTQMVAFETLSRNGREMAVHADVADAAQTVTVAVPGVGTTATDEADGDKTVAADPASGVTDTVELTGLVVGREYTLRAALMSVDADGNASPLASGGAEVRAEKAFTATEPNMTVDMGMAFDSSALPEGAKLVAFEELLRGEAVIADHKDASDAGQTVAVAHPRVGTIAADALDGDKLASCDTEMRVADDVSYSGVVPGREYAVEGTLMVKSTYDDGAVTAEPLLRGGEPVRASATFTPQSTEGTVTVEFAFDGSDLPEGTELVAYEKLIRAGAEVASHEDATDAGQTITVAKPYLRTTALDAVDGDKVVASDPEACVVDKVAFANAAVGKAYRIVGELVELDDDGQAGEVVARGEASFTAEQAAGEAEVVFDVDATKLVGKKLVVFERLYRGETLICEHAEADDADQTIDEVRKPEVGTTATDAVDGDKRACRDTEMRICDEVRYAGAVPGREYTVQGTLMLKSAGDDGAVSAEPLMRDGAPVQATTTFTPESAEGSATLEFAFDGSDLPEGTELVAYEKLIRCGIEVASHEDATDAGQTVEVYTPEIDTSAADAVDGDKAAVADRELKISDEVRLSGIVPGKEYTLRASAIVLAPVIGEDGVAQGWEKVGEVDGAPMGETTFTADEDSCTQKVELTVPALSLEGCKLVVAERLYRGKSEIANHVSEDDAEQTVDVTASRIGTTATDGLDGDKNVVADPRAKVVDSIAYENVVPGTEHTAIGLLMDKQTCAPVLAGEVADDQADELAGQASELAEMLAAALDGDEAEDRENGTGEEGAADVGAARAELAAAFAGAHKTGEIDLAALKAKVAEAFPDLAGHLVWSETSFTPEAADGQVEVAFDFDASRWLMTGGCEATAFEMLVRDGQLAAVHADIDDVEQTVAIVPPQIGTELTDTTDGDHALQPSTTAKLVDTVSYENLIPGKSYKLTGKLMDKETGQPVLVDGAEVAAEAELVPEEASGTAEVVFEFDSTGLSGKSLVCFERLEKEGLEVAVHADIDDAAQTVTVEEPGAPVDETVGEAYDDTGAAIGYAAAGAAALAVAGAGAIAWGLRRRRKGEAEKEA